MTSCFTLPYEVGVLAWLDRWMLKDGTQTIQSFADPAAVLLGNQLGAVQPLFPFAFHVESLIAPEYLPAIFGGYIQFRAYHISISCISFHNSHIRAGNGL
jgi:hypothetical protein